MAILIPEARVEEMKIKFFTNPTGQLLPLRYIVVNPTTPDKHTRYIKNNLDVIKEILIDTGVDYLFNKLNLRDYPQWWINSYVDFVRKIVKITWGHGIKILSVIPDVPVDYPGREHLYPWNIKRTLEYIEYFLEKVIPQLSNVIWIAPVQGRRDDINSVLRTYIENLDIYNRFDYVAISPTCTTRKHKLLADLIIRFDIMLQHYNKKQKYHVFGPSLKTIKLVINKARNMYSFDSTAYYWFNNRKTSNPKERSEALVLYCRKLEELGVDVPCPQ